jgi:hypothetical protein
MGRYMTIVLKEEYKNDIFIEQLNETLVKEYGANTYPKFNPWYELQTEADYFNKNPEGKKQLPDWKRPITAKRLSKNFFWFTNGIFSTKLSGGTTSDEGRDAVAVCKWIVKTNQRYINAEESSNYDQETVAEYLNEAFKEDGYDLTLLWEM